MTGRELPVMHWHSGHGPMGNHDWCSNPAQCKCPCPICVERVGLARAIAEVWELPLMDVGLDTAGVSDEVLCFADAAVDAVLEWVKKRAQEQT